MKLENAKRYADELVDCLKLTCDRIEIAGGVRREKAEPHDIELVAIPLMDGEKNLLHEKIGDLLSFYPSFFTGAPRNKSGGKAPFSGKYFKFCYKGELVDLFLVMPPAQWGTVFLMRTGDADFSREFFTRLHDFGLHSVNGHIEDMKTGQIVNTSEELSALGLCNLPWIRPEDRTLGAIKRVAPL